MPKHHIMRFMHFEVSPAGRFTWLCMLFYNVFFNSVFTVTLMCAGVPYMGMLGHAHSAVPAPSPTLLRHCWSLHSALCFRDYCQKLPTLKTQGNNAMPQKHVIILFTWNEGLQVSACYSVYKTQTLSLIKSGFSHISQADWTGPEHMGSGMSGGM